MPTKKPYDRLNRLLGSEAGSSYTFFKRRESAPQRSNANKLSYKSNDKKGKDGSKIQKKSQRGGDMYLSGGSWRTRVAASKTTALGSSKTSTVRDSSKRMLTQKRRTPREKENDKSKPQNIENTALGSLVT